MLSAQEMAARWKESMKEGKTQKRYQEGIEKVRENPMEKAASPEATELYVRRVQEAVDSGKRERKLLSASFADWKKTAKSVGSQRLASGADKGAAKSDKHFEQWASVYNSVSQEVAAMPKGTREAAKARVAKAIDLMMDAANRN